MYLQEKKKSHCLIQEFSYLTLLIYHTALLGRGEEVGAKNLI